MSVAGYLSRVRELRMPKVCVDETGVRFTGPVLTGEESVEARRAADSIRVRTGDEEVYRSVEDYDPVLRAHCRL